MQLQFDELVISADSHVIEPPNVFDRVPASLRDRAPKLMRGPDGGDGWSFNGQPPKRTYGIEVMAGREKTDFQLGGLRFDQIRKGFWDGAAHLEDLALDGMSGSVLFPNNSAAVYSLPDRELGVACMKSYNDWLLEDFQSVDPRRLVGLVMLPVDDGMEAAVAELERVARKGAKGCFIPGMPERPYNDPYYEPLWKAASDANLSLNLHRTLGGKPDKSDWDELVEQRVSVGGIVFRYFSSVRPLTYLIFSGVFDRHPNLKIVAGEVDCGWIPFWAQTMDAHWEKQQSWFPQKLEHKPSDFLGVNCFVTTIDDYVGYDLMKTGKYPYLSKMTMFSTDYPHSATTWPNSRAVAEELTAGMTPEVKTAVLADNARKLYHMDA
jgi:predicted TIM-barrel fold metal-dependent hydrolase